MAFKTLEFSLIHLQADDTRVNEAWGESCSLSDPSELVIQGAHVKTLLTANEAFQTQTITVKDVQFYSDLVWLMFFESLVMDRKQTK